jgi:Predicted phosphoesterase
MIEEAKKFKADILIYGHTHKKELAKYDSLIVLNPGSTSIPKDGSRSVAIIDSGKIVLIDIENNGSILSELYIK